MNETLRLLLDRREEIERRLREEPLSDEQRHALRQERRQIKSHPLHFAHFYGVGADKIERH